MKTIPAGEFKTHCLRIMDEVRKRRQPVIITKKGVPVAKLVPVEDTERDVVGCLEGVMEIVGDIEAPLSHCPRITPEIAALATAFPADFPSDPVDRLIGATARSLGLPLVTRDQRILDSSLLKTVW